METADENVTEPPRACFSRALICQELRREIIANLDAENKRCNQFETIFASYNNVFKYMAKQSKGRSKRVNYLPNEKDVLIEELQSKLQDLYCKKEQNDQLLIETNKRLSELQANFNALTIVKETLQKENAGLKLKLEEKELAVVELNNTMQLLHDERVALELSYNATNDELLRKTNENSGYIEQLKKLKEEQAEFFNCQNELEKRERQLREQIKLENASKVTLNQLDDKGFELIGISQDGLEGTSIGDIIPSSCIFKSTLGTEGNLNDVKWYPTGDFFATGGDERKIWTMSLIDGKAEKKSCYIGNNGGVLRIDFNPESRQLLGANADSAVRIWGIDDQRVKHTFTGHTDKVSSARFIEAFSKVISGSYDRSIKCWDLHSCKCVRTYLPGSIVFDIASSPYYNTMFVSGHFDKQIRIWDSRSHDEKTVICMNERVTSLFFPQGPSNFLLCSTRGATLSLIDLRTSQTLHVYSAEQYRTSGDLNRCVCSSDGKYCAIGSADGQIFIWDIQSTKLEKVLHRGSHNVPITSISWHPRGHLIVSVDRARTVCLWA